MKRGFIYETVSEQGNDWPSNEWSDVTENDLRRYLCAAGRFFSPFGNHRRSAVCHNKFVKLSIKFSAHSCKPRSTKSVVH